MIAEKTGVDECIYESIRRDNFTKYLFLGVLSPGKSYVFLQNFEKALLETLICSYGISSSWKIVCVLAEFEKALMEVLMCSSTLCFSWKIVMCSYTIFGSPRKFDVFL